MTKTDVDRGVNFVAAAPDEATAILPALPPAHAVTVIPRDDDLVVEDVLAKSGMRAIEKTSPLLTAQAFLLKYAGLSAVLAILAVGLTWQLSAPAPTAIVIFGGMSFVGYWLLGWTEAQFTTAGVERLRLREGGRTLRAKISADENVALAQVDLQAEIVRAQAEYNRQQNERLAARITAQVARHETPQTVNNRHANYAPPSWLQAARQADERRSAAHPTQRGDGRRFVVVGETENSVASAVSPEVDTGYTDATCAPTYAIAAPTRLYHRDELSPPSWMQERAEVRIRDEARRTLTDFVAGLYARDDNGAWLRLHDDGRIRRDVKTPLSARSGVSAPLRDQIAGMLAELDRCGSWLLRYDEAQRLYRLNLDLYPTPDEAIDALGDVPTMRRM